MQMYETCSTSLEDSHFCSKNKAWFMLDAVASARGSRATNDVNAHGAKASRAGASRILIHETRSFENGRI